MLLICGFGTASCFKSVVVGGSYTSSLVPVGDHRTAIKLSDIYSRSEFGDFETVVSFSHCLDM